MKKLLVLAVLCAAPASAQEAPRWPVEASGATCAIEQSFSNADFGTNSLQVSYDPAREFVTLTATSATPLAIPTASPVRLAIVFLDNGGQAHDDQWGSRTFTASQADGSRVLVTGFSGESNVRQIFADLAASKALGLLYDGEVVTAFDLLGAGQAIARLRDCARQTAQS